jgi:hypothetical protein
MNEPLLVLDVIAIVLAALLALIGFGAAQRYRDRRFAFVGAALAALGFIGVVGVVDLLEPGLIPGAELGTVPVGFLILAEALLYLSFVASRSWTPPPSNP